MVVVSSTTNHQWPQNSTDDERTTLNIIMASNGGGGNKVMEESSQDQEKHHQQQQHLKCPRCDSSNTKFCYYNNYSLSQPRHFCKACKRYWTRGGTLRSVPVGGGCRKNKRIKKPSSSSSSSAITDHNIITTTSSTPNVSAIDHIHGPRIDFQPLYHRHSGGKTDDYASLYQVMSDNDQSKSSSIAPITSNIHANPLFYGLPTNPNSDHLNLPFPRMFGSRVSNIDNIVSGFDNHIGLGFHSSSSGHDNGYGFNSSSSLLSSYPIFGSSSNSSSSSSSSSLASLIASSLEQQKFMSNSNSYDHRLGPYEELQMPGTNNNNNNNSVDEVKMEGDDQNKLDWNNLSNIDQNQMEQQITSSDPSLSWSTGAWLDPSNLGSSVPSLI